MVSGLYDLNSFLKEPTANTVRWKMSNNLKEMSNMKVFLQIVTNGT